MLGLLFAQFASAVVTVNLVIDPANTDGTILGNTISDLMVGDTITVLIEVDNTAGPDDIISLFTSIQFDSNMLSFVGGENLSPILNGGFGGPILVAATPPEQVFGQPAGTLVGLPFMSTSGGTTEPGPEFGAELVFVVFGGGTSNLLQLYSPGDQSIVNGVTNDADGSPELVFGPPLTVTTDFDGDLVPDSMDNCLGLPNGPNELSNQVDTDRDGYGNICDADFNQTGVVTGADFTLFVSSFNTSQELYDLNGSGSITGADYTIFVDSFNRAPGGSGLSCADPTIDIQAGDPPCLP